MVPSYRGTPCLVAPLTGFFQSLVPEANPMKFSTPIGALSGNSVQVSLPTVVLMTAIGFDGVACTAGLAAAPGFAAGAPCALGVDCAHAAAAEITTIRAIFLRK